MRNAMICVSVMLALFLGWPLAFGGGDSPVRIETSRAEARPVSAVAGEQPAQLIPAVAQLEPVKPESCYKHYQRVIRQCPAKGTSSAACRQQAADHWDLCEARGFWPD